MAGDEGTKPMAGSFTRMLLQRRMLANLIFFSSGLILGCYMTTLSNDQHGTDSAVAKLSLRTQYQTAAYNAAAQGSKCICPGGVTGVTTGAVTGSSSSTSGQSRQALQSGSSELWKQVQPMLPPAKPNKALSKIETVALVDAKQAFDAFFPHLPYNVRDQISEQGVVLATTNSGLRMPKAHRLGDSVDLDTLSTCKEVDALLLSRGRCYVALNTDLLFTSYHVQRYKHEQEGATGTQGWEMIPRITKEGSFPPLPVNRQKHERFLRELLDNLPSLEKEAAALLTQAADKHNRVIIMALNQGDVDMLLNFLCSAHEHNIPLDNLVVFGGDQVVADIARSLGLKAFWHKAFGPLPTAHAKHYGDAGFLAMMWLKIVSVWVATRLGFNVLFQDADLVWFRDPWGMFEDPSIDGFFMDDGSRSERFSPLYANSGFYYLQSNPRVLHLMQTVLFSYDMIVQYASHQTIVIQALQEHISRNGLKIRILKDVEFVGGKVFHHNKALMEQIREGSYVPYTFHMCWTQTKADKLKNVKLAGLWFLKEECSVLESILALSEADSLSMGACCVNPRNPAAIAAS